MAKHWSCESCGKDTTDKRSHCEECNEIVCQPCWHGKHDHD